jgi:hypothetical protein
MASLLEDEADDQDVTSDSIRRALVPDKAR